jgi:hypothetical protein
MLVAEEDVVGEVPTDDEQNATTTLLLELGLDLGVGVAAHRVHARACAASSALIKTLSVGYCLTTSVGALM